MSLAVLSKAAKAARLKGYIKCMEFCFVQIQPPHNAPPAPPRVPTSLTSVAAESSCVPQATHPSLPATPLSQEARRRVAPSRRRASSVLSRLGGVAAGTAPAGGDGVAHEQHRKLAMIESPRNSIASCCHAEMHRQVLLPLRKMQPHRRHHTTCLASATVPTSTALQRQRATPAGRHRQLSAVRRPPEARRRQRLPCAWISSTVQYRARNVLKDAAVAEAE